MARLPRLYLPGCAQHVIQRGNNREACFYDEADYKAYLSFLKEAATKYQVAIHAFVLMTNHVHLLVTPSNEQGISRMMQLRAASTFSTSILPMVVPELCGKGDTNPHWSMQTVIY